MEPIDHYFSVSISDDGTVAYLQVKEIPNPFRCTTDQLVALLHQKGVTTGIDLKQLAEVAMEASKYSGGKIVVAQGTAPVQGESGKIRYLYEEKNRQVEQERLADGRVDLRSVTRLNNVKKGELLAEKIAPSQGVPGKSVTGELLVPPPGKEALFKVGKNVVQNEDQTRLYAAIDGLVSVTDRGKINVFPIYEVNGDVDYKIGNIDFNGTVIVRGSVLAGFRIKANGDIRVTGTVDAAFLEANGSIDVFEGVVGQHKGELKAAHNVKCSFIQDAHIVAGDDVVVSQSIMHSQIQAGNHVICQGGNGLIVGGSVQAGSKVIARTIGNAMSTQTLIEVGVHPELRKELAELRQRHKTQSENADKSEKALKLLDQMAAAGQLDEAKMKMRQNLDHTYKQVKQELDEIKERLLEIEKILESTTKANVEVGAVIYPGTKLVIGRSVRFVKDPVKGVRFFNDGGEITYTTLY